jgi:peptidoglycan/LPS O-acetylase OafA/YrhL
MAQRLPEADLLRAGALLGVGVIHAGAWITPADAPPGTSAMAAASELARFCVPAFVFASGFLLFHSYGQRPFKRAEFLKRRWLRVLLPWACCVPLFLLLDAGRGDPALRPDAVGGWLASGPGHLYFLLLVAQLYLLFLVLPRDHVRLRWVTAGLVALQLGLMAWRSYGSPAAHGYEEAPFWMGTFALGCLASAEWQRLARLWRLWPVGLALCALSGALVLAEGQAISAAHEGSLAYLWPSRLPQTVVWSVTLLWLGRALASRPLVGELSRHSLGIYLLHPVFLDALGPRTSVLPPAVRAPLLLAASFAAAYAAVRLLALRRGTALAIGESSADGEPRPARGRVLRRSARPAGA